ncbi:MAG: PEP-CTERM sorting domain-containing protein [Syntrophobacteraceae bacterium]|nr:PEP-CTERM sorting domain-containing protein [Syntrophobacteraceae bacterium]
MKKAIFLTTTTVFLLCSVVMANADSIYLGNTFNPIYLTGSGLSQPVGGGSVTPAILNTTTLRYDFCIDLNTDVSVPGTYTAYVTNNGTINNGTVQVTNAGEIAYLLHTYAGSTLSTDQQIAIQAAIWHFENNNVSLNESHYGSTSDVWNYYSTYITNTGTYSLSDFYWITPVSQSGAYLQAQIAPDPSVPEPSTLILLTFSLIGVAVYTKYKGAHIRQANQPVSPFLKLV